MASGRSVYWRICANGQNNRRAGAPHLQGEQHVEAAKATGKTIIFVSCHYGNWEMLMVGIARLAGRAPRFIARPAILIWKNGLSKCAGRICQFKSRKGPRGQEMLSLIKQGTTPLCLLIDQRMTERRQSALSRTRDNSTSRRFGWRANMAADNSDPYQAATKSKRRCHFTQIFDEALYIPKTDNAKAILKRACRPYSINLTNGYMTTLPLGFGCMIALKNEYL